MNRPTNNKTQYVIDLNNIPSTTPAIRGTDPIVTIAIDVARAVQNETKRRKRAWGGKFWSKVWERFKRKERY